MPLRTQASATPTSVFTSSEDSAKRRPRFASANRLCAPAPSHREAKTLRISAMGMVVADRSRRIIVFRDDGIRDRLCDPRPRSVGRSAPPAGAARAGGDEAARHTLETLAGKTAKLAADGDEGAKTIVDQMKRQGIALSPPQQ